MSTITAGKGDPRRDGMGRIWTLAIGLNLLVVVPFLVWQDLRRSDFTVEPKTAEERAAEQRKREELAKKPKPEIPEDQIKQAKEHIERRKKAELKKEVEDLERLKAEIERLKEEQLEALEERDEEHFLAQLVEAIKEQAEELVVRAEDLERNDQVDEARKLREQAQSLRGEAAQIQAPVAQAGGEVAVPNPDQARKVAELAKAMAGEAADYARQKPSPQAEDVRDRADRLAHRAESLAASDATAALDGFTQEAVPEAGELASEAAEVQAQAEALATDAAAMHGEEQTGDAAAIAAGCEQLKQQATALAAAAASAPAAAPSAADLARQSNALSDQADAVANQTAAHAGVKPSQRSAGVDAKAQQLAQRAAGLANQAAAASAAEAAALDGLASAELYDRARALESAIAANVADSKAAELALTQGTSFQKGLEAVATPRSQAEDLGDALGQDPGTRAELAAFSAAMDAAIANAGRAAENARAQLGQSAGRQQGREGNGMAESIAQAAALGNALGQASMHQEGTRGMMVDLTGLMSQAYGGGSSESGVRAGSNLATGGQSMTEGVRRSQINLDANRIRAQALPGRKFSRSSTRTGWLFIDSWYVIGPFENRGRIDFTQRHPPETSIDLDGEYIGKQGRNLKWKYLQSNVMRINPPDEQSNSTYYGSTEVWFEEETDMLLAVASDDAAKVWINDIVVWQDTGLSAWQLDEGFRKVRFKKGFNPILVRIENGPVVCYYSLLLCPANLD